ncbi:MAG: class I SAM-dependent methyltransferase [Planctomycetes bacterium]|nr:class I SAM-dependent methyltransferase [Planctomycetota bacterium]
MTQLTKPADRTWFERGGRHTLECRIQDFGPALENLDLSTYSAIDIGCAEGDITGWLAKRFRQVDALEYMDACYTKAHTRFKDNPNITVRQGDISTFPLSKDYDFVFFLGVLHFFTSEEIRQRLLRYCLDHAQHACFVRTAIHDFHVRDQRNLARLEHFVTLETLHSLAGDEFDIHVVDNGYLVTTERAVGDLVVYRRRSYNNPLPLLSEIYSTSAV